MSNAAESIVLREGLPGYWRHNPPTGKVWWHVEKCPGEGRYAVYENHDDRLPPMDPLTVVPSLDAAREWIERRQSSIA